MTVTKHFSKCKFIKYIGFKQFLYYWKQNPVVWKHSLFFLISEDLLSKVHIIPGVTFCFHEGKGLKHQDLLMSKGIGGKFHHIISADFI